MINYYKSLVDPTMNALSPSSALPLPLADIYLWPVLKT